MKVIEGIEVLTTLEELVDPKQTALMCIDMQNDNVSERGHMGPRVAPVRAIIPNIQRLLDAGRRAGALVTYAEFIHRNRDGVSLLDGPELWPHRDQSSIRLMQEDSWEAQTIDELTPQAGDLVILKSRGSAFCDTPLDSNLGAPAHKERHHYWHCHVGLRIRDLDRCAYARLLPSASYGRDR